VPWITWRFDVALTQRSYWKIAQAGALYGLSALGGYPALIIIDSIFLGLWGLGRLYVGLGNRHPPVPGTNKKSMLFTFAGLCLLGVIGAAIMSPSYAGFFKYTRGYTTRVNGISRDYALKSGPLPPQALGTAASPFLYLLNWPPYIIWPETDISNDNIYMGALVVSLAAIALLKGCKWRLWLAGMIIFFMSCAVGNHLPVRGWLYDFIPPTRYFRFPSLFSGYGIVVFCALAAYGSRDIDTVLKSDDSGKRIAFVVVSGSAAIAAAITYFWILRTVHLKIDNIKHPFHLFLIMWISVLAIFFLWWKRCISNRVLLVGLVVIAVYDAASTFKVSIPTMYSTASTPWWKIMSSKHVGSLDLTSTGLARQLFPPDELGGRYQHNRNVVLKVPVFANDTGMVNQFFQPYVADPVLNQLAVGTQRVWFSAHPAWSPPSPNAFADYARASHALGVPPMVLHTREEMVAASAEPVPEPQAGNKMVIQDAQSVSHANVELLTYSPNILSFRYNAPEDGWLLVTDRWAPDWHASVNGRPVPIAGANFLFRGIPVSYGKNDVLFTYEPRGYLSMVILSWGILVVVAIGSIVRCRSSRRLTVHKSTLSVS
jgi:hypothetical protein